MPKPKRQFIDGPFGQVHLRIAKPDSPSRHPPLICLHQSPKSSREFIPFMTRASRERLVIAIDNPGHGESDIPPAESKATIESYAQSAWAVIDALELGTVDILGHHTGSSVATEMAFQRGEDVGRIVMISAALLTPEEQANFAESFLPIPLDEAGTRFTESWKRALHYKAKETTLERLANSYVENFRAGEAYEWGHQAAFAYNEHIADRISGLPHEIMVLNPQDLLHEYTMRIEPLLKNGRVINLPEWGFGFLEATPDAAVKVVLDLLN